MVHGEINNYLLICMQHFLAWCYRKFTFLLFLQPMWRLRHIGTWKP